MIIKGPAAVLAAALLALTAACGTGHAQDQGRLCHGAGSVLAGAEGAVRHLAHAGNTAAGGRLERD